jgi:two-component system, OmpR family, copper resistance phosphate regulon response regulator CusR
VRLLVVEDERKLARALASALEAEHYEVVVAPTGEEGFFQANAAIFDLVVLGRTVAPCSAFYCRSARSQRAS